MGMLLLDAISQIYRFTESYEALLAFALSLVSPEQMSKKKAK